MTLFVDFSHILKAKKFKRYVLSLLKLNRITLSLGSRDSQSRNRLLTSFFLLFDIGTSVLFINNRLIG